MKKYALLRAASAGSRPETNTAEQRIFANPARPFDVGDPTGVGYDGGVCQAARAAPAATPPAKTRDSDSLDSVLHF